VMGGLVLSGHGLIIRLRICKRGLAGMTRLWNGWLDAGRVRWIDR
jgi:hypothetical protein